MLDVHAQNTDGPEHPDTMVRGIMTAQSRSRSRWSFVDYSASNYLRISSFFLQFRRVITIVWSRSFTVESLYSVMSVQQWVTPLEGLDSLRQTEAPMPIPGPGEVLVEVHAVSLNYRDVEG